MRYLIRSLFCIVAGFFVLVSACSKVQAEPLQQKLERAYSELAEACKKGDLQLVEKRGSSRWLAGVKNNYASSKLAFGPEQVKEMAENLPGLDRKGFVKVLQRGPTAGLVYAADSDERDATNRQRVTFTFVKFVKEGGSWKFHGLMQMGDLKYRAPGLLTEFSEKNLPPEMAIDGKVVEAPAPVGKPEMVGMVDVFSYGYSTEVYINGVRQVVKADGSYSGLIRGGLQSGKNTLRVMIRRIKGDQAPPPTVTIRVVQGKGEATEAFKFTPSGRVVGTHDLMFTVNVK